VQEKHLFEYAIVRLVPCVEREEFVNVGVVVYCRERQFLKSAFELNETRVRAVCADVDIDEVREHLRSFEQICSGGDTAGPIGKLPAGERFRWLTAPRSTIVQTSPVHTGLSRDVDETLEALLVKMVR
jgi:hypothetical protein